MVGTLLAFAVVGSIFAGQFGSRGGADGSPIPSGSGDGRTVSTAYVSLRAPAEWGARPEEPGFIGLKRDDVPAEILVEALDLDEPMTLDELAAITRESSLRLTDARVCIDQAAEMPGLDVPARLIATCYTETAGTSPMAAVQAALVAVSPDGLVVHDVRLAGPADRIDQLAAIVERTIYPTIVWHRTGAAGAPGTSAAPSASPSPGEAAGFCAPLAANWSSAALVGQGIEVTELRAPNSTYVLFSGGLTVLTTALGPSDGYASFEEADALARQSLVQLDARRIRWVVVEHADRYFVYQARMYEAGTYERDGPDPAFFENPFPAPCRMHPDDGTLTGWRAQTFESNGAVGDWLGAVWRPDGAAMCGEGVIPTIFPGIPAC